MVRNIQIHDFLRGIAILNLDKAFVYFADYTPFFSPYQRIQIAGICVKILTMVFVLKY